MNCIFEINYQCLPFQLLNQPVTIYVKSAQYPHNNILLRKLNRRNNIVFTWQRQLNQIPLINWVLMQHSEFILNQLFRSILSCLYPILRTPAAAVQLQSPRLLHIWPGPQMTMAPCCVMPAILLDIRVLHVSHISSHQVQYYIFCFVIILQQDW